MARIFTLPAPPSPPASIAHLTTSNVPGESTVVRSYIQELKSQIACLDTTRIALNRGIAAVNARQQELRLSIKAFEATLSPVRRLPPEILGLIFSAATPKQDHPEADIDMRRTPWLLTRVCRYWSTVALSMPALWSCLDLTLDCIGENGTVPLTELQIQRSQNMPLTLTIRDEEGPGAQDSHPVLQLALSASHRWKVADLHMKPSLFQQMTAACGFSSLTTLLITINLSPDDRFGEVSDFDDAFWNLFSAAPELRCVRALCWSDFGLTTAPFILPWQQLTHLSTAFASNTEALTMLGKLPNIIQCTLTLSESNVLPMHHRIFRLSHMSTLKLLIEEDDPPVVYHKHTSVLDFLETPTLTSLTVYLTADEEAILGLVTRSNCASCLTMLHLHSSSIDHDMALHLTKKLPHLTSLELGDFDGTLFPRSSMPDFVKAFSKQWLELQAAVRDHTLSMQIVDRSFEKEDARRLTSKLTSLDVHGLFIIVSSAPRSPGRIRVMERFSY